MKRRVISLKQSMDTFFHSIRFRLVLWFVVILAVVMAIFSAFIYWRQAQDVRSIATGELNFTMERMLGPAHEGEGTLEQPVLGQLLPGNVQNLSADMQQYDVIALQGTDGSIEQSLGALTTEQIQQLDLPQNGWSGVQQTTVRDVSGIASKRYLFTNPALLQNGQVRGYLLVGVPLDPNNQLGRLLLTLVLGNLLTLAIALTGGFWLADRAMRPVHSITQTAQEISATDLHKRLHLTGKDELAELGGTFNEMLDRLQAAFERQRQFTADASHELRTPLTIINLEAGRALATRRSTDEYERILHTIHSENQFMIRLVNNLLSLARMDAGQVKLTAETFELHDLVQEVAERMQPLAKTKGVGLTLDTEQGITVHGDRSTLVQMVTNLVENAIKFSSTVQSPQVHISMGKRDEANGRIAWVRVKDNGIGIAPEHQVHIFDRFYQTNEARNRTDVSEGPEDYPESSGTGLGLAIACWIAQAHHGGIRVESAVGQGSTFEAFLPINNHAHPTH